VVADRASKTRSAHADPFDPTADDMSALSHVHVMILGSSSNNGIETFIGWSTVLSAAQIDTGAPQIELIGLAPQQAGAAEWIRSPNVSLLLPAVFSETDRRHDSVVEAGSM
jgi:hypothetical protein